MSNLKEEEGAGKEGGRSRNRMQSPDARAQASLAKKAARIAGMSVAELDAHIQELRQLIQQRTEKINATVREACQKLQIYNIGITVQSLPGLPGPSKTDSILYIVEIEQKKDKKPIGHGKGGKVERDLGPLLLELFDLVDFEHDLVAYVTQKNKIRFELFDQSKNLKKLASTHQ